MSTWTIMRIRSGVTFLSADTVALDMAVTKMSPSPMIKVLVMRLVTAKAEQMPKIWRKTGFSSQTPFRKMVRALSAAISKFGSSLFDPTKEGRFF